MEKYDDIINMEHHVSKKHPQMSIHDRSAQFAPFAALTGFGDMVYETARFVDKKIELNEEKQEEINIKLMDIKAKIGTKPTVAVTYFVPDKNKNGGQYITIIDKVIKIDGFEKSIILENKTKILIENILEIM